MVEKKAFNFYRNYYDILKAMSPKQRAEFIMALTSVMFFEQHIDDVRFNDPMMRIVWASIKFSLQQSIDGFLSKNNITYNQALSTPPQGSTAGACQGAAAGACAPPYLQEEGKGEVKGKGKGKGEGKQNTVAVRPDDVSEDVWNDFLLLRKQKRAPLTKTAFNGIKNQAAKASISVEKAITIACERGWQTFKAEWQRDNGQFTPSGVSGVDVWEQLISKIGVVSRDKYPEWDDENIAKALFHVGTWMELCGMKPGDQKFQFKPKFMAAYRKLNQ